jgi:hypothetical protein
MPSKTRSGVLRVAVGTQDEARSSVWRLWAHGDDVYFGTRDTLPAFKVSLHQSGIWRIAFVRALDAKEKDADRVALKWQRPSEHAPGSTSAVVVVVSSILPKRPFKSLKITDTQIKWLALPPPHRVLTLSVLLIKPGITVDPILYRTNKLLGGLKKANGETVCLLPHERELTEPIVAKIHEIMRGVKINIPGKASEDSILSSRALMVVAEQNIGASNPPAIYDVPLGWDNVVDGAPRTIG